MNNKRHPFLAAVGICLSLFLSASANAQSKPPSSPVPAADRDALRLRAVRKMDARASLDLLTRTLAATQDPAIQATLMRGMLKGLDGRRNVPTPKNWKHVSTQLEKSPLPNIVKMSRHLSQIFGDQAATAKALATLRNDKAATADRRAALKSLIIQQNVELRKELEKLIDDPDLRIDAIRAYSSLADKQAPKILLAHYSDFDDASKRAVIETLSTRNQYSLALIKAIAEKTVPKKDIPAYIARSLQGQHSKIFTAAYGNLGELSKDKTALIKKYKKLLSHQALTKAKASNGRAIFQRTCAPCHVLYGDGGKIGPELTGSNRADLDYILLNILDPSGDIPDAYKLVSITTKGGQLLAGTIAQEDEQRIILNMVGVSTTVLKSDIKKRGTSPLSMMPEGLLQTLKPNEIIDLIKYLQSTQQVNLPK
ncbi:MAG: c-type cytochrome [Verrucomicrobiales bacterium]|nr:c-type cytochrome [Verrucomicrobiales bacterium]